MKTTKSTLNSNRMDVNIHARDGIVDIVLGLLIVLISVSLSVDSTPSPMILGIFIPLLVKQLKQKYIYPRSQAQVVTEELQSNLVKRQWLIAIILAAGLLGFVLSISMENSDQNLSPLFNIMGILVSGTIIIGGISGQSFFYFYAMLLSIPVIVMQISHGLWLGTAILSSITLLVILAIVWIGLKQRKHLPDAVMDGYERVTHSFLAEAGWVFFAYFVLATYFPEFAGWVRHLIITNAELVFGNIIAFFILIMGIVYKTFRYNLYALLVSFSFILFAKMPETCVFPHYVLMVPGLLIIIWGSVLLISFVKNQPIIPKVEE